VDQLVTESTMSTRIVFRSLAVASCGVALSVSVLSATTAGASTNWMIPLLGGPHGVASSQPAITTSTGNPSSFTAACVASNKEDATLTWTSAGAGVTGYAIYVSSTVNGTFALDATQPSGTALTVTETYTGSPGNLFYRLEAASVNWAFPGTNVTNARVVAVLGTIGGYLTMAHSGTKCTDTA
jgi:hypothetical protein